MDPHIQQVTNWETRRYESQSNYEYESLTEAGQAKKDC